MNYSNIAVEFPKCPRCGRRMVLTPSGILKCPYCGYTIHKFYKARKWQGRAWEGRPNVRRF